MGHQWRDTIVSTNRYGCYLSTTLKFATITVILLSCLHLAVLTIKIYQVYADKRKQGAWSGNYQCPSFLIIQRIRCPGSFEQLDISIKKLLGSLYTCRLKKM